MTQPGLASYHFGDAGLSHAASYLLPAVSNILRRELPTPASARLLDLGCGNASVTAALAAQGYPIEGADPSEEGIRLARAAHPALRLHVGAAGDELARELGQFDAVICLEVIEHVYAPANFARCLRALVQPGGLAIVSTPYHGYAKNLALALSGKLDAHFTALWEHGHIKFWSRRTLGALLVSAGFPSVAFRRVGRVGPLAKSMIAIAK